MQDNSGRLLGILGVAVILFLLLVWRFPIPQNLSINVDALRNLRVLFAVALFGIMGACISSIQRLTRAKTAQEIRKIPDAILEEWTTLLRPGIGAAAALALLAAAVSGISITGISIQPLTPPSILVLGFAAGFSERLLMEVIESFGAVEQ